LLQNGETPSLQIFSDDETLGEIAFEIQISAAVAEDNNLANKIQITIVYSKADHELPRF